jgi:HTH-type transcriptional regulator/antitoxin HigA
MTDRTPAEAFPPGEILRDELEARGWTQTEFAQIIGRPIQVVNEIISAKRSVTPETAKALAAALGTSAQLWMNLESSYQLSKAAPAPERISREAKLREKFPLREMVKRGWIEASEERDETEARLLKFFHLQSIDDPISLPHAAKRSVGNGEIEPLPSIQLAWLFRVKQIAEVVQAKAYSEKALRDALPQLEALTMDPEEARHVARILMDCGVRFVIVEPVPGSKIDGVCFWVNGNRSPVIGMTLRFDRNDNFWFVLRHEIEHVLRKHGQSAMIIDELGAGDGSASGVTEEERVANEAGQEFCVPKREMDDFIARVRPFFSEEKIVRFARRIHRHPGIVIGQLQHRIEKPDHLNKLKAKIRQYVTSGALTDGWGQTAAI